MKYLSLLLSVLFIASCATTGRRSPSSDPRPRHYVITLHGVRGNEESYGKFHEIVTRNLEDIDPSYRVEVKNWTYPVGKAVEVEGKFEWTPHQIARKLNTEIFLGDATTKPWIKEMGPNDKISFIAYSMGGMMIMSWYYDTMFNFQFHPELKYSDADHQKLLGFMEKVDNIVGLGAVYWGSVDAELGWSMMKNGDLTEIKKAIPKIQALCSTPEAKKIIGDTTLVSLGKGLVTKDEKPATPQEKRDAVVKNSVYAACAALNAIQGDLAQWALNKSQALPDKVLEQIKAASRNFGNVSPRELDHMRLTSDTINEMRIGRVRHMDLSAYRNRFKTRWTSIVGVFPCLGKLDKGLTCTEFAGADFKTVNDGLTTVFSGAKRRETDGPVVSPSAVADFMYYIEQPGKENQNVSFESFVDTKDISAKASIPNSEIFVENMHATVAPALEALPAILKGKAAADAMTGFDKSLGVDVVIVNKECADPETCEHPNYKHILQSLAKCELGNISCDQDLMNKYYHVANSSQRMADNMALRDELGSFYVTMNIRIPKSSPLKASDLNQNIQKYFKIAYRDAGKGFMNEARVDMDSAPYLMQVNRSSEIMPSYASIQEYSNMKVVRVFFAGRMMPKAGKDAAAKALMANGLPMRMEVALPGVAPRRVVAKVKPAYSTYVDMYMK